MLTPNVSQISKVALRLFNCNLVHYKGVRRRYSELRYGLVEKNPDLTDEEITKIKNENTENLLTDEQQTNVDDELDKKQFSVIMLYHIFARNDAAIRKVKEGEEQIPEKEVAQKLNLVLRFFSNFFSSTLALHFGLISPGVFFAFFFP